MMVDLSMIFQERMNDGEGWPHERAQPLRTCGVGLVRAAARARTTFADMLCMAGY